MSADEPEASDSAVAWSRLATEAPDGLALVDADGRFVRVNPAGARLCGRAAEDLVGTAAPFPHATDDDGEPVGLFDEASTERVTTWSPAPEVQRELAYRAHRLPGAPCRIAVAFRDVTEERQRQRRVTAIARTAAKLASQGELTGLLDALADEVVQADALAGAQILTLDETGHGLRLMGSAGFPHWPDFLDRLTECRRRGATLVMLDALRRREPVIIVNRWSAIRDDPVWAPIHDYLNQVRWQSFASVPLLTRGQTVGVLNAYFAPGQAVGPRTLEFLAAMAEQAAIAVDYAALMQRERDVARREERQRLARDLHDSIVQQVFSISMQAKSMEVLGGREGEIPAAMVRQSAGEIGSLAHTVLADLRAMVHELRPPSSTELGGLEEAVRALLDSTGNRTGLRFSLAVGRGVERVKGEIAEDVYRIVAEAVHNVVKHAAADTVAIRLVVREDRLRATVTDDGRGIAATGGAPRGREAAGADRGYGLRTMRERAERWGGTVTVAPRPSHGTVVRFVVPLAAGVPLATRVPLAATDRPAPATPARDQERERELDREPEPRWEPGRKPEPGRDPARGQEPEPMRELGREAELGREPEPAPDTTPASSPAPGRPRRVS